LKALCENEDRLSSELTGELAEILKHIGTADAIRLRGLSEPCLESSFL